MHNSMFTKQDNFARGTNEPLPVLLNTLHRALGFSEGLFLHSTIYRVGNAHIIVSREGNRTSLEEGTPQVVQQIDRIFNAYAKTDKVFRETTCGAHSRINGSMSGDVKR